MVSFAESLIYDENLNLTIFKFYKENTQLLIFIIPSATERKNVFPIWKILSVNKVIINHSFFINISERLSGCDEKQLKLG